MTPTSSPRRRGASLALGGIFVVASTLLASAPMAYAAPSTEAVNAINDHYTQFGGESSPLGAPTGEAVEIKGGVEKDYANGAIFYSKETGPQAMYGEIFKKYQALGGPSGELGFPTNDEADTGDGVGRFNDFTEQNGESASIYWAPSSGAWLIKGKVLEAWRQAGGIKSPFGYPNADTTTADDTLTSTFVGPDGTQIQWSKAAGLVTIPAALAGKIPGFGTEGTTSMSKPSVTAPSAPSVEKKGGFKWWWLIPILALLGLLAFLPRLFRKPVAVEPVKVAAPVKKVVPPAPPAPPVKKVVAPPPPPRPAPKPPVPPAPKPVVKTPPPPPAPKPVARPVEHIREEVAEVKAHIREEIAETKAHIREVHAEHEVSPVIKYESTAPVETTIQVTYENNAVGDHQESRADKSDLTPDHLQE